MASKSGKLNTGYPPYEAAPDSRRFLLCHNFSNLTNTLVSTAVMAPDHIRRGERYEQLLEVILQRYVAASRDIFGR